MYAYILPNKHELFTCYTTKKKKKKKVTITTMVFYKSNYNKNDQHHS